MERVYYSFSEFLRKKFNKKIRKIPINAGFACPNKDGKKSLEGCTFCDEYGSGPIKTYDLSIEEQIENFIKKDPGKSFIAYFQAHSNTYAAVNELAEKYNIIFRYPQIVGFFIGTRPDAIKDDVFPLLKSISKKIYLSVELGLQSVHEKSLKFLNRNHTFEEFIKTFDRLRENEIDVIIHLIVGIPNETRDDILDTIKKINHLKPAGIKLHLMHILRNTPLYDQYLRAPFPLLKQEEYEELIVDILEHLDPDIVIHRLTGERDLKIFYHPQWALNKSSIINSIKNKMINRESFQGKKFY